MKIKAIAVILASIISISFMLTARGSAFEPTNDPIVIKENGSGNFSIMRQAIQNQSDGEIIFLYNGESMEPYIILIYLNRGYTDCSLPAIQPIYKE